MNYPAKGALLRAARAIGAGLLATLVAGLIAQTPVALEGTSFSIFAVGVTAAILAADKYIRERWFPSDTLVVIK